MSRQQIRVMVIVQQPIFRQGILALLRAMTICEIIGQPTSAGEALELARICEPEVALFDTFVETIDVFELARQMRTCSPRTAVILLCERESNEWLLWAVKAGAAAYYARNVAAERLAAAIEQVSQGEYMIEADVLSQPDAVNRVLPLSRKRSTSSREDLHPLAPNPLSTRETEVVEIIAKGKSNKEIGQQLGISDQTVKNHITSLLRKLGVNDRTAAVVCAITQRWIILE